MIDDILNNSIEKLTKNEPLNMLELLSLSIFIGGDNINKYSGGELYNKLDTSLEYINYRNSNTLLSTDNTSYLVCEKIPFKIKYDDNTKNGEVLMNIEMIAMPPSEDIVGETPLDILFNMEDEDIIEIILNTFNIDFSSEEITAYSKDDLISKLSEYNRISDSGIIFKVEDIIFIIANINGVLEYKCILNTSVNKEKIINLSSSEDLDKILGDTNLNSLEYNI